MTDVVERVPLPPAEFSALLACELPALKRFCLALTKRRELGEDLFQDTCERALIAQSQFAAGTNLKWWLRTIARNRFLTDMRRAWRVVEMAEGQAERVPIPCSQDKALELKDALEAVSYLPPEQAQAILAAADGLTMEEMAEEFGIAEGTVKSRVSRARDALTIYFGGH